MAKDTKDKQQQRADSNRWSRVRIRRAISMGGLAFRPRIDGGNVVPVEAVILAADAALHGPDYLEILQADVARPASGIPRLVGSDEVTPDNKQTTEAVVK
jgi:hypothetical protein